MKRGQRMAFKDAIALVPDDLSDGAFWALAHELAGLDYGDGFDEISPPDSQQGKRSMRRGHSYRPVRSAVPADVETVIVSYDVAMAIYDGSSGEATIALYRRLDDLGAIGSVAMNLFRAHKASARAKVYRGGDSKGSWRSQAYEKKQWSLDNLAKALDRSAGELGIVWGWGVDLAQEFHQCVLYVELPTGQVSFHCERRGLGPDYPGRWDGAIKQGQNRICRWIERLFKELAK